MNRSAVLLPALAAACFGAPSVHAGDAGPRQVGSAIALRRDRVAEFRIIKEAAEELGFRVWLFGGTAAGFAHYVRWDLAREEGDPRYRESFFDYDFTNIYRSTQDADLVADATPEQAVQLEKLIKEKLSFLQGSKEQWEVRLLRYPRTVGEQVKLPLLGNPDFLEQNTDSNSTGMIELTDPPRGEAVVRDLRDWESSLPFFLRDVTEGRLHYYLSPTHQKTSRYLSGDNPPLFSVIRYLVKAFQYDLAVDGEDLKNVRAIIDAFDPGRDYTSLSPWAKGWLERYGPNLIRHAVNIEYAWDTLERLGLRRKLISLSQPGQPGTLGWWLSREPLRTLPLGEGQGKTAGELGITTVAHETSDFLAYESITRDSTLRPNVLVSRPDHNGESAALGEGFYSMKGRTGAKGTGLTIRFAVDPAAREGADFRLHGDAVVFTNRAALRVIPESLDLTMPAYFRLLADGFRIDRSDRGVWTKFQRRLSIHQLAPGEKAELAEIVAEAIRQQGESVPDALLQAWLELPQSENHPQVIQAFLERMPKALTSLSPDDPLSPLVRRWFSLPVSREHPELEERMAEVASRAIAGQIARSRLPPTPRTNLDQRRAPMLYDWFRMPFALRHPELAAELIEQGGVIEEMDALFALRQPGWSDHPELAWAVLRKGTIDNLVVFLMEEPQWARYPELMRALIERALTPEDLEKNYHFRVLPNVVRALSQPHWSSHPELVLSLVAGLDLETPHRNGFNGEDRDEVRYLLESPQWRDHPLLRRLCGGQPPTGALLQQALRRAGGSPAERIAAALAALSVPPVFPECP